MPCLATHPIHLGAGATALIQPPLTGPEWYAAYGTRHAVDGAEGRLVMQHSFTGSWTEWEVHPHGAEVVICIAGRISLLQEHPNGRRVGETLSAGDYAINPPGVWHTVDADPEAEATCIFITSGEGTQHRPR